MAKSKIIKIDKESICGGLIRDFVIEVHPVGFLVYLAICAYSNDDKTSEVSIPIIMRITGLSRMTVFRCIEALEKEKYIKRLQKKRGYTQIFKLFIKK